MLTAILVTLVALVVLGVLAIVIFRIRSNTSQVKTRKKMGVKSIMSVGVSAETPKVSSFGGKSSVITPSSTKVSQDSMRSRFTALGVIVAGVFGILTAKLFSMQVIEASSYKREAEENLYTTVATPAPRGVVYDCDGIALVTNRQVQ
ncbi:MAG: penicillin-binding protein 2, partial [Anaerotardibacter sp.]